jgi:hypothetical protein
MREIEQTKAAGDLGLSGLGRRALLAPNEEKQDEAGHRSNPPGA